MVNDDIDYIPFIVCKSGKVYPATPSHEFVADQFSIDREDERKFWLRARVYPETKVIEIAGGMNDWYERQAGWYGRLIWQAYEKIK